MGVLNLTRTKLRLLAYALGYIVTAVAFLSYRQYLIDRGVNQCQQQNAVRVAQTQQRINNAVQQALAAEKAKWLEWHQHELDRAKRQAEARVVYEQITKEIPVVVESTECTNLGPDVLRLFNDAYAVSRRATPAVSH